MLRQIQYTRTLTYQQISTNFFFPCLFLSLILFLGKNVTPLLDTIYFHYEFSNPTVNLLWRICHYQTYYSPMQISPFVPTSNTIYLIKNKECYSQYEENIFSLLYSITRRISFHSRKAFIAKCRRAKFQIIAETNYTVLVLPIKETNISSTYTK